MTVRLFIPDDLSPGAGVALSRDHAHYLFSVMRLGAGAGLLVFNGRDGEWSATVAEASRKAGTLRIDEQTRAQGSPPDLWLAFAPVKKARTDFIAEKAAEMGCRRILPVFTRHTNAERVRADRLRAHAVEAAEQCGLLSVPEVADPVPLPTLLEEWDSTRRILFCDETMTAPPAAEVLRAAGPGPWAVLTGPEGGFAPQEAAHLRALPHAHAATLGPRVLRADTAAVAALAVWQSVLGDWRGAAVGYTGG